MTQPRPVPFTDPVLTEIAARWVAARRDPASALRAAREGLAHFGLLGGFHIALARFEAAVRADERARVTDESQRPMAPCFGCHHIAPWHVGELGVQGRRCTGTGCNCTDLTTES